VQLSTLVTGNTYRNPPMLAKAVTTLDVVSKGRAILGIGAGWFEREHNDFGYEFGTFSERFEKLEEALTIIAPMLRGENPTVKGKHYHVENAMNNPRLRPTIPIMLGGGGEKKTFRLAAHFADHMNIICDRADVPAKLTALRQRCEEADRDPATLPTSYLASVFLAENEAEVRALQERIPPERGARVFAGRPEQVAEQIKTDLFDRGITGITINMILDGHVPGKVALAGETLRPLLP
jgi:alkanesulfonate monooxygenase SsuD/methylene tetrahydromethanopterin reductase-like flavin-dependent oxidoreductase (luciferase family)